MWLRQARLGGQVVSQSAQVSSKIGSTMGAARQVAPFAVGRTAARSCSQSICIAAQSAGAIQGLVGMGLPGRLVSFSIGLACIWRSLNYDFVTASHHVSCKLYVFLVCPYHLLHGPCVFICTQAKEVLFGDM